MYYHSFTVSVVLVAFPVSAEAVAQARKDLDAAKTFVERCNVVKRGRWRPVEQGEYGERNMLIL